MQELAQADSRVERMMQLESLFTRDPDLLRDYLKDLRDRLDYENSFKWARTDGLTEGLAKGEAKGRVEGEAKGRAEGRAEGMAQGMAQGEAQGEARAKAEMARSLLRMGLEVEKVSEVTGLSPEAIAALT